MRILYFVYLEKIRKISVEILTLQQLFCTCEYFAKVLKNMDMDNSMIVTLVPLSNILHIFLPCTL